MKRFIFMLALALLSIGQGFGPKIIKGPLPSQLGSVPDSPPTSANLALWWHAGDQITNKISSVTNWVDRIQGKVFYWDGKTNAPTLGTNANGTLYVRFNFSALTNSVNISVDPYPGTWMLVFSVDNNGENTFWDIPINGYGGPFVSNGYLYQGAPAAGYCAKGLPKDDTIVDVIIPHPVSTGGVNFSAWTNGVNGTVTNANGDVSIPFGNVGAKWNSGVPGWENRFFRGKICDILRYTNVLWDGAAISNGHYWRTNFYGGTP